MGDVPRLNGWNEWSKYVLKTLESVDARLGLIQAQIVESKLEIERLKTRAQIWGGLTGAAAGIAITFALNVVLFLMRQKNGV